MWTLKAKLRASNGLADPAAVLCLSEHPASVAPGRFFTDPIPTQLTSLVRHVHLVDVRASDGMPPASPLSQPPRRHAPDPLSTLRGRTGALPSRTRRAADLVLEVPEQAVRASTDVSRCPSRRCARRPTSWRAEWCCSPTSGRCFGAAGARPRRCRPPARSSCACRPRRDRRSSSCSQPSMASPCSACCTCAPLLHAPLHESLAAETTRVSDIDPLLTPVFFNTTLLM